MSFTSDNDRGEIPGVRDHNSDSESSAPLQTPQGSAQKPKRKEDRRPSRFGGRKRIYETQRSLMRSQNVSSNARCSEEQKPVTVDTLDDIPASDRLSSPIPYDSGHRDPSNQNNSHSRTYKERIWRAVNGESVHNKKRRILQRSPSEPRPSSLSYALAKLSRSESRTIALDPFHHTIPTPSQDFPSRMQEVELLQSVQGDTILKSRLDLDVQRLDSDGHLVTETWLIVLSDDPHMEINQALQIADFTDQREPTQAELRATLEAIWKEYQRLRVTVKNMSVLIQTRLNNSLFAPTSPPTVADESTDSQNRGQADRAPNSHQLSRKADPLHDPHIRPNLSNAEINESEAFRRARTKYRLDAQRLQYEAEQLENMAAELLGDFSPREGGPIAIHEEIREDKRANEDKYDRDGFFKNYSQQQGDECGIRDRYRIYEVFERDPEAICLPSQTIQSGLQPLNELEKSRPGNALREKGHVLTTSSPDVSNLESRVEMMHQKHEKPRLGSPRMHTEHAEKSAEREQWHQERQNSPQSYTNLLEPAHQQIRELQEQCRFLLAMIVNAMNASKDVLSERSQWRAALQIQVENDIVKTNDRYTDTQQAQQDFLHQQHISPPKPENAQNTGSHISKTSSPLLVRDAVTTTMPIVRRNRPSPIDIPPKPERNLGQTCRSPRSPGHFESLVTRIQPNANAKTDLNSSPGLMKATQAVPHTSTFWLNALSRVDSPNSPSALNKMYEEADKLPITFQDEAVLLSDFVGLDRNHEKQTFQCGEIVKVFNSHEYFWLVQKSDKPTDVPCFVPRLFLQEVCPHGIVYDQHFRVIKDYRQKNTSGHVRCQKGEFVISAHVQHNRASKDTLGDQYHCVKTLDRHEKGYISAKHLQSAEKQPTVSPSTIDRTCSCIPPRSYATRAIVLRDCFGSPGRHELRENDILEVAHIEPGLEGFACVKDSKGGWQGCIQTAFLSILRQPRILDSHEEYTLDLTPRFFPIRESGWFEGEHSDIESAKRGFRQPPRGTAPFSDDAKKAWEDNMQGNNPHHKTWNQAFAELSGGRVHNPWSQGLSGSGAYYIEPQVHYTLPAMLKETLTFNPMGPASARNDPVRHEPVKLSVRYARSRSFIDTQITNHEGRMIKRALGIGYQPLSKISVKNSRGYDSEPDIRQASRMSRSYIFRKNMEGKPEAVKAAQDHTYDEILDICRRWGHAPEARTAVYKHRRRLVHADPSLRTFPWGKELKHLVDGKAPQKLHFRTHRPDERFDTTKLHLSPAQMSRIWNARVQPYYVDVKVAHDEVAEIFDTGLKVVYRLSSSRRSNPPRSIHPKDWLVIVQAHHEMWNTIWKSQQMNHWLVYPISLDFKSLDRLWSTPQDSATPKENFAAYVLAQDLAWHHPYLMTAKHNPASPDSASNSGKDLVLLRRYEVRGIWMCFQDGSLKSFKSTEIDLNSPSSWCPYYDFVSSGVLRLACTRDVLESRLKEISEASTQNISSIGITSWSRLRWLFEVQGSKAEAETWIYMPAEGYMADYVLCETFGVGGNNTMHELDQRRVNWNEPYLVKITLDVYDDVDEQNDCADQGPGSWCIVLSQTRDHSICKTVKGQILEFSNEQMRQKVENMAMVSLKELVEGDLLYMLDIESLDFSADSPVEGSDPSSTESTSGTRSVIEAQSQSPGSDGHRPAHNTSSSQKQTTQNEGSESRSANIDSALKASSLNSKSPNAFLTPSSEVIFSQIIDSIKAWDREGSARSSRWTDDENDKLRPSPLRVEQQEQHNAVKVETGPQQDHEATMLEQQLEKFINPENRYQAVVIHKRRQRIATNHDRQYRRKPKGQSVTALLANRRQAGRLTRPANPGENTVFDEPEPSSTQDCDANTSQDGPDFSGLKSSEISGGSVEVQGEASSPKALRNASRPRRDPIYGRGAEHVLDDDAQAIVKASALKPLEVLEQLSQISQMPEEDREWFAHMTFAEIGRQMSLRNFSLESPPWSGFKYREKHIDVLPRIEHFRQLPMDGKVTWPIFEVRPPSMGTQLPKLPDNKVASNSTVITPSDTAEILKRSDSESGSSLYDSPARPTQVLARSKDSFGHEIYYPPHRPQQVFEQTKWMETLLSPYDMKDVIQLSPQEALETHEGEFSGSARTNPSTVLSSVGSIFSRRASIIHGRYSKSSTSPTLVESPARSISGARSLSNVSNLPESSSAAIERAQRNSISREESAVGAHHSKESALSKPEELLESWTSEAETLLGDASTSSDKDALSSPSTETFEIGSGLSINDAHIDFKDLPSLHSEKFKPNPKQGIEKAVTYYEPFHTPQKGLPIISGAASLYSSTKLIATIVHILAALITQIMSMSTTNLTDTDQRLSSIGPLYRLTRNLSSVRHTLTATILKGTRSCVTRLRDVYHAFSAELWLVRQQLTYIFMLIVPTTLHVLAATLLKGTATSISLHDAYRWWWKGMYGTVVVYLFLSLWFVRAEWLEVNGLAGPLVVSRARMNGGWEWDGCGM